MAVLTLRFDTDPGDPEYGVIEFHGELDHDTKMNAERDILSFLENFAGHFLIFDFSQLDFINSEGIGFVVSVHSSLAKHGKKLLITAPKPHVKDVLELIGLHRMLEIFSDISSALAQIKKETRETG